MTRGTWTTILPLAILALSSCRGSKPGTDAGPDATPIADVAHTETSEVSMDVKVPLDLAAEQRSTDVCQADCEGRACGPDGCGGHCGACPGDLACDSEGHCPDCTTTVGLPGGLGSLCVDPSDCIHGYCHTALDGNSPICTCPCQVDCPEPFECQLAADAPYPMFHGCFGPCQPDCAGKDCGPDGCGGQCGECGEGLACLAGICSCPPACGERRCGDDGCGGSCGDCLPGALCLAGGVCQSVCTQTCEESACGPDSCGGWCWQCGDVQICPDDQNCLDQCVPDCQGKQCGSDGCAGSCGSCPDGQFCDAGNCVDACVPACGLKQCGSDGCGGDCGKCDDGIICTVAGWCGGSCAECTYHDYCSDIDFASGNLAQWVVDGAEVVQSFGWTKAPTGGFMLKLSTAYMQEEEASRAALQNCLPPGDYVMSMTWRMYSVEFSSCGGSYQDTLEVSLKAKDATLAELSVTIDDLCPPGECEGCGKIDAGVHESDVKVEKRHMSNTLWIDSSVAVSITEDTKRFAADFRLFDVGDSTGDSIVLIDRVRFVPVDQVCEQLGCAASPDDASCPGCPDAQVCVGGNCCQLSCEGKECGDDGCGGSCGVCHDTTDPCFDGPCPVHDFECLDGACVEINQ